MHQFVYYTLTGFKIKTPLVNNVGAGVDYLDYYDNLPVEVCNFQFVESFVDFP